MPFRFAALLLASLGMQPSDALAQRVLTLDSVVAVAQAHSPELPSARLAIRQADLARREVLLPGFPALHYKAGASYAPAGSKWGYDPAVTNEGELSGQLSFAGTVYAGGITPYKVKQADLDLAHANTNLALTQENLRFDIAQAYLEALRANGVINIQHESIAELRDYRDFVERLFKGGTAAYTDVLKTEVQLGTEVAALDRARADEVQAKFTLAALMGAPNDTAFTVRGSYDSILGEATYTTLNYDSLLSLSVDLAQNELERARIDVDLARARAKPTVDINLDAGLLTGVQNLLAPPGERNGMLGASAGITVEGPIFDWGLNKLQVEEKQVQVQILESQLDRQKRELYAEIVQLSALLRTARERLAQIRANVQKARDAYELERAKYAVGGALASEVLDSHKQLTDAKLAELDILNDIETYRSNLTHVTAKPNVTSSGSSSTDSNQNGQ